MSVLGQVCGMGRVGSNVAHELAVTDRPYVAIEHSQALPRSRRVTNTPVHCMNYCFAPGGHVNSMKWALWSLALFSSLAFGQGSTGRTKGQLLYLPIYSHIWHGEVTRKGEPIKTLLSVSVSIRNTDPSKPILITSAQYFNTDGKRLKEYVPAPKTIAPMGTYELFIPRSDDTGGSGANFVIAWKSDATVNAPIVEAIHADLPGATSITFTTSARQILVE